jgi:glycosyltransferase involved in cell wall biosynthesis
MRIALLGTRGIPASYSGFETCVEQLGQRLAARDHEVTVYCRSHHITYQDKYYKGMRLVKLPTIPNKYFDTIVHSFISSLHALFQRYDVALYFIAGNSLVTWIPRLVGTKTIINVDGLDWRREKWPPLAKKYIQLAEYLATILPTEYLTDSRHVQGYYRQQFGGEPVYIPYGSEVNILPPREILARYNLLPRKYVLFVGRLVPENCAHHLVEAFRSIKTDMKCVIVGDAPYAEDYKVYLKKLAEGDERIIFTGYVFGNGYQELGSNAYLFVESSGVGGTHPALVEAMAFGNCVVVHDTPENIETIGGGLAGFAYEGQSGAASLGKILKRLIEDPETVRRCRPKTREFAQKNYSWDAVTDEYERLFYRLVNQTPPERLRNLHVDPQKE